MSITKEIFSEYNETIKTSSVLVDSCAESWIPSVSFTLATELTDVILQPWVMSLMGSTLVGLSGILPLLIIPVDSTATLKNGTGAKTLRVLLSFAVGGLLGDVFLHLLPEAWENQYLQTVAGKGAHPSLTCGMWVLAGLLAFIIIEKVFSFEKDDVEDEECEEVPAGDAYKAGINKSVSIRRKKSSFILNDLTVNYDTGANLVDTSDGRVAGNNNNNNDDDDGDEEKEKLSPLAKKTAPNVRISGYLNLMANSIDNFTHGLAVGGSFMLSTRVGVFTTFAILVHEIPHEVGDFAILLRAGFSRWDAAWAQVYTASAGILGAITALMFNASANAVEARTSWILPFTAGGFLHIALVTVLPELLDEKNPKESLKQMCSLATGITVMAVLTALVEG